MRRTPLSIGALAAGIVVAAGCGILNPKVVPPPKPGGYLPPISPENVIYNMSKLYMNRDVARYDSSLTQDYVFRITYHGQDNRIGHDGWVQYTIQPNVTLDFANGNDYLLNSPAQWYFKEEPAGSGTWKLAEWQDMNGSTGAARVHSLARILQDLSGLGLQAFLPGAGKIPLPPA